jgi:hypothetical protein
MKTCWNQLNQMLSHLWTASLSLAWQSILINDHWSVVVKRTHIRRRSRSWNRSCSFHRKTSSELLGLLQPQELLCREGKIELMSREQLPRRAQMSLLFIGLEIERVTK